MQILQQKYCFKTVFI